MEGGQDGTSQPPSPFFFPSPIPGGPFSQIYLLLFRRTLATALIMDCLCFPDHEAPSLETIRDDILVGSPALMDITILGFCTDLAVAGSCVFLAFGY
jgi:hypothetical protein